jgi:hypothetical protein
MFDHTILGGHFLRRQRQADSDRGQEAFRHVGDDDPDEEDDGVTPVVAEYEGDDEEDDADEDGHARDDVNEVVDLPGQLRLVDLQAVRSSEILTYLLILQGVVHK